MSKFELDLYGGVRESVAERIAAFYGRHPDGRIITGLVARTEAEVTFRAQVYRSSADGRPAATGWAFGHLVAGVGGGGGGANDDVSWLENAETCAVGRALAHLGFADPARRVEARWGESRGVGPRQAGPEQGELQRSDSHQGEPRPPSSEAMSVLPQSSQATSIQLSAQAALQDADRHAIAVADVHRLLVEAQRVGMRPARAAAVRERLSVRYDEEEIAHVEAALRDYLARRLRERVGSTLDARPTRLRAGSRKGPR
ncbi:MAG TPA: hypothetical protein VKZ41_09070 [Gemmatimonadales bacterium]|nr:hypothetical protein [Gemmatimonadales bacterium]